MSAPVFSAPFPPVVPLATPYSSALPSFLSPLGKVLDRIDATRQSLNLPEPGKAEELGREAKSTDDFLRFPLPPRLAFVSIAVTHLTNYTFDGARAELSKTLSQNPAFQVTHSFLAGSQGQMGISPGTYNFGALYAHEKMFLHGLIDNEGGVQGRFNYSWSPANTSKMSVQLGGQNPVMALEQDRVGKDYTLNVKAMNPNLTDLSGMYFASYLQSVSQHVAIGVDSVYQRQAPGVEECSVGYMAKWHHTAKDENGQMARDSWIATAQILPQGFWQASYWKKLAPSVEAAVDVLISPALSPRERKAVATAGVKYEFRQSSFRGQVDSTGKVSALLEQRLSPAFAFLVAGEMDHAKSTSKFGVGCMIESADEAVMEAAMQAQAPTPPL
ncbi:hypothetical protein P7C70_g1039, partial [Phenoliferia sp. Uapishka_3]